MTRAVIYARYSSDNQRDASIEDQVRQCRARIGQEGWQRGEVYSDHAISRMPLFAGRPLYSNSRTAPTLTERTLPALVAISSSPSRFTSAPSMNSRSSTEISSALVSRAKCPGWASGSSVKREISRATASAIDGPVALTIAVL
jgi:hypothetical protein